VQPVDDYASAAGASSRWSTAGAASFEAPEPEQEREGVLLPFFKCAAPGCIYRAHTMSDKYGAWCCKRCYSIYMFHGGVKPKRRAWHGVRCEKNLIEPGDKPAMDWWHPHNDCEDSDWVADCPPIRDMPRNPHPELVTRRNKARYRAQPYWEHLQFDVWGNRVRTRPPPQQPDEESES